jgi:hypothetical protein
MIVATRPANSVTAADVPVSRLDNNSLIVRLHYTVNHLSRWLTPVHHRALLERSVFRGEPSIKQLLLELRDEELIVFPKMHLIATQPDPNLDKLPPVERSAQDARWESFASALSVMAEFRRLRQSTLSLLRSLPDNAWHRFGTSRVEHDWVLRDLAELLANHDVQVLSRIDQTLDKIGAREGLSPAACTHLDELLRLTPVTLRS